MCNLCDGLGFVAARRTSDQTRFAFRCYCPIGVRQAWGYPEWNPSVYKGFIPEIAIKPTKQELENGKIIFANFGKPKEEKKAEEDVCPF